MAECECLKGCPFFNGKMKENAGMAGLYKNKYCLGDNRQCARYQVFTKLGRAAVPDDLYPNMQDRARALLAG